MGDYQSGPATPGYGPSATPGYGPPAMPGYGPPATPRPGAPIGYIVVVVVFAVLGGLVDALFSFGMLFATDSCGTSAGSALVCNPAVWAFVVVLPWAGLLAAVLIAAVGAVRARRRGRSPWPVLLVAVAAYLLAAGVAFLLVFGT
ncbi:hypothetical protein ACIQF6_00940 [Kitasatospora sp. NPDC092948]|uniref:hypothetical protein n=1 Tax=Kitasatospora sp. NPDC092948 TaxID=3364088 RepID=UPI00381EDD32